MEKYWLLLESYTFIWSNKNEIVLYDTLSGRGTYLKNNMDISRIVNQLTDISNLYVTEINETDLSNTNINKFIKSLQNRFLGDIYPQSMFPNRPLVLIPKSNINDDTDSIAINDNNAILGQELLKNLTSITIHLSENCTNNCDACLDSWKQMQWCVKSHNNFDIDVLSDTLEQLTRSNVLVIDYILCSDIFENKQLMNKYINTIEKYKLNSRLFFHWRSSLKISDEIYNNFPVILLIDEVNEGFIEEYNDYLHSKNVFNYHFRVNSEIEYLKTIEFINAVGTKNYKITPLYTGHNQSFFEKYVFWDKKDILRTKWTKKNIFSNQHLNYNHYGKLTIRSNGDVYTNLFTEPTGNIKYDQITTIIRKELLTPNTLWKRTRDNCTPCNECLYRYICPPISNYEISMNRMNLCTIKR